MLWVTWRQHRAELLAAGAVMAVLAALVIVTGVQMHSAFDALGVAGCLPDNAPPSCAGVTASYQQQFSGYIALYQWLNLGPLALGIFIGAPLVAREVERNTHLLAWTQGITRARWMTTQVLVLLGLAVVLGAAFTLLTTWWLQPVVALDGSALPPSDFDLSGVVSIGYFAAALAMGVAAGTLIRRTLPAMAVTIAAFVVARFVTIGVLRPGFMAPITSSALVGSAAPTPRGAWVLQDSLVNPNGQLFSGRFAIDQVCAGAGGKSSLNACLQGHGVVERLVYQPADRYWAFQGIEVAGFAVLAAALLLLSVWWVRRRIS